MTDRNFEIRDGVLVRYLGTDAVVHLPDCTEIGQEAFYENEYVQRVIFSERIEKVGYCAFQWCRRLSEVVLNERLTVIEPLAFNGCGALRNLRFNEGLEEIGFGAFGNCVSLESLYIPSTLRCIDTCTLGEGPGGYAFEGCVGLKEILVHPDNAWYADDGCHAILRKPYDGTAHTELVFGCQNSVLREGITSICAEAFYRNVNLKSIRFPATLQRIGAYAFAGCTALQAVEIPAGVKSIADTAFQGCNLDSIRVDEANEFYTSADSGCLIDRDRHAVLLGSKHAVIPADTKQIGAAAFWGVDVKELHIPRNVYEISQYAFCESGLERIEIEEGLLHIGLGAFAKCKHLKEVTLPHSLIDRMNRGGCVEEGGVADAFGGSSPRIIFHGTAYEWRAVYRGRLSGAEVICTVEAPSAKDRLSLLLFGKYGGYCGLSTEESEPPVSMPEEKNFKNALAFLPVYFTNLDETDDADALLDGMIREMLAEGYGEEEVSTFMGEWLEQIHRTLDRFSYATMWFSLFGRYQCGDRWVQAPCFEDEDFETALRYVPLYINILQRRGIDPELDVKHLATEMAEHAYKQEDIETFLLQAAAYSAPLRHCVRCLLKDGVCRSEDGTVLSLPKMKNEAKYAAFVEKYGDGT